MNLKSILTTFTLLLFVSVYAVAQSPIGVWKTIDDNTGEARSHIEIFEQNGKLHGKLVKLLTAGDDAICENCTGDKKNKPLMNMVILSDLEPYKDYWSYGKIMDPDSGKEYKANISMNGKDKLDVRGYIGFAALGRTQTWERLK